MTITRYYTNDVSAYGSDTTESQMKQYQANEERLCRELVAKHYPHAEFYYQQEEGLRASQMWYVLGHSYSPEIEQSLRYMYNQQQIFEKAWEGVE